MHDVYSTLTTDRAADFKQMISIRQCNQASEMDLPSRRILPLLLLGYTLLAWSTLGAEQIRVRFLQGQVHGFLMVRSVAGAVIGNGELSQTAEGDQVTARLILHLRGGSIDDETTIYRQREVFALISDRHIQRGPFFADPVDATILASGDVIIRRVDKDGKEKVERSHLVAPPDLANGMIAALLTNIPAQSPEFRVSYFAPAGKGRLLQLRITPDTKSSFSIVGARHTVDVYRLHPELGGVASMVAPLIGKQPEDVLIYVLEGASPSFVREVGTLQDGGPLVSLELAGTTFAPASASAKKY